MYLRIGRYLSRILALSVLIWADIGLLVGIALRSPVLRHATTRVAIAATRSGCSASSLLRYFATTGAGSKSSGRNSASATSSTWPRPRSPSLPDTEHRGLNIYS